MAPARARETDEPAEKHRLCPMAGKEGLGLVETLGLEPETRAMAEQPLTTEATAQLIPDVVAYDGAEGPYHDHRIKVQQTLLGKEPGCEHEALSGNQKSDEGGTLECCHQKDDDIAPVSQAGDQVQDVLQHQSSLAGLGARLNRRPTPAAPEDGTQQGSDQCQRRVDAQKADAEGPETATCWIREHTAEDDKQLAGKDPKPHGRPVQRDQETPKCSSGQQGSRVISALRVPRLGASGNPGRQQPDGGTKDEADEECGPAARIHDDAGAWRERRKIHPATMAIAYSTTPVKYTAPPTAWSRSSQPA